jgi:NAD(P)-dependent dehydrogenase (short-subunit alcohol dehydrogenase family)
MASPPLGGPFTPAVGQEPHVQIEGRTAVITGAASGLGRAVAERLAAAGARVAIVDLPSSDGKEVAATLGGEFFGADVTDEDEVRAVVAAVTAWAGAPAIAVTCAGVVAVGRTVGRAGAFSLESFRRVLEVNVTGTFNVTRLCAEAMRNNDPDGDGDRGVIVTVASISGLDGPEGQVAYSASKAAVAGMTLPMARDLQRHAIRVVCVAPGTFETPMVLASTPAEVDALVSRVPHPKRLGRPAEFARLVRDVIENPFLNGTVLRLDGANRLV